MWLLNINAWKHFLVHTQNKNVNLEMSIICWSLCCNNLVVEERNLDLGKCLLCPALLWCSCRFAAGELFFFQQPRECLDPKLLPWAVLTWLQTGRWIILDTVVLQFHSIIICDIHWNQWEETYLLIHVPKSTMCETGSWKSYCWLACQPVSPVPALFQFLLHALSGITQMISLITVLYCFKIFQPLW